MTISASSPDLLARLERLQCISDVSNSSGRWVVTLKRPGEGPITGESDLLPEAVAAAVRLAESWEWHRRDASKG